MSSRHTRSEDGSALLIALIFVTVFGVIISVVLSFADTNFRLTSATRLQRSTVYDADAAVESAIAHYRQHSACPPSAAGPNTGQVVTVICTIDDSRAKAPTNAPKVAVAAVGSGADDGVSAESGGTTFIRGGVASKTRISVSSGAHLSVNGIVEARGECGPGAITQLNPTITPPVQCSYTPAAGAEDLTADPGYPMAAAAAAVPATIDASTITCAGSGPVTLPFGSYRSATDLNKLFSGSCAGRVFLFPPASGGVGVYHFDFSDTGSHKWTIAGVDVVGGTIPVGHTASDLSSTCVGPTCLPPGQRCDQEANGVQFIFGGDSQLNVASGGLELCAQPSTTEQQIAIYGVKANSVASSSLDRDGTAASGTFTVTAGALPASALLTKANDNKSPRTLNVTGFDLSTLPATASINAAELVVTHTDLSTDLAKLQLPFTVSGTSWSWPKPTPSLNPEAVAPERFDLRAQGFDTPAKLAGLTFALSAYTNSKDAAWTATATVSRVQLRLTYTASGGYLAQSGCVTANTCVFLSASGPDVKLSIHGTVYAPLGGLDLQLVGDTFPVVERGVVVRRLQGLITGSAACSSLPPPLPDSCFPFQLPAEPTSFADVVFKAVIDGRTRVRAWVAFPDCPTPTTCDQRGAPTVKSWSTVNEDPGLL